MEKLSNGHWLKRYILDSFELFTSNKANVKIDYEQLNEAVTSDSIAQSQIANAFMVGNKKVDPLSSSSTKALIRGDVIFGWKHVCS